VQGINSPEKSLVKQKCKAQFMVLALCNNCLPQIFSGRWYGRRKWKSPYKLLSYRGFIRDCSNTCHPKWRI